MSLVTNGYSGVRARLLSAEFGATHCPMPHNLPLRFAVAQLRLRTFWTSGGAVAAH